MSTQKLDDNEVEQLLRSGMTQVRVVQIYKEHGIAVSQSAISQAVSTGRINVDTDRAAGAIPWRLNPQHRHLHAARMLRTQNRLDNGLAIGPTLRKQVASWREGLAAEDSVIHYDPDTEQGFWRVPRRPGVDLGWVREPGLNDDGTPA